MSAGVPRRTLDIPGRLHARLSTRLRLSRLELIGGSGRTAGCYASAARAFISPTAFEQAREALWEREATGSGLQGGAACLLTLRV